MMQEILNFDVHPNSVRSFHEELEAGAISKRHRMILGVLQCGYGLTDREIANRLGFADLNAVRPRITELVKLGAVQEVGSTKCLETGKQVRIIRRGQK